MKLYNTPKKTVEEVKPLKPGKVTVYTCGPTVYNYPHIGNWFTFVRYDLLVRALKASGLDVTWVMNITDVGHLVSDADEGEDKLEKGARREGKSAWDIAKLYGDNFVEGLKKLNFLPIDELPKATDHIPEQIELVKTLEGKGLTYIIDDGVYFNTSKFPRYADFAGLKLDEQEAGARVAVNEQKKNPTDFALWKFSPAGHKRDMEWDSPWGKGFPGWHLECSAMSMKYLGETIDIHAGGIDHIPVHHTNEIAQSEAATGKPFVNHWLHTNHISVEGEKISKSLDNGITLEDIEAKGFTPEDVRMLVLESHYRTQSIFSWDTLGAAHNRVKKWQSAADLRFQPQDKGSFQLVDLDYEAYRHDIGSSLADDLGTPRALTSVERLFDDLPFSERSMEDPRLVKFLHYLNDVTGIDLLKSRDINATQKSLISERQKARDNQDWAAADKLRAQLAAAGIGLNDGSAGQIWYRL